jgi:UDP-N-acetyl-D-glucosamine/UDP-N-acetyl-D-galactosamine dehydrogenase
MIYDDLISKNKTLAVIGLGYVGLPIALEFAKKIKVIGFDINEERVEKMRNKIDPSCELESIAFEGCDITFTTSLEELKKANFFIVAVPTPVDEHNVPDLKPVLSASKTVGSVIKNGDYVVFESTVYPGCTEEDCVPVVESVSGLKSIVDFKVGYSPERINPGDKVHTLVNTIKIVSACDKASLEEVANVYKIVIHAGVHKAPTIKVAEAGKIIENTQRDLNISLMNELSIIFDKMGINTYDVIEAAGTKWNFHKYHPGLVGGHCISVDPFYLTYKADQLGYTSQVISAGRRVNDSMPAFIAKKIIQHIIKNNNDVKESKVLVLGVTFKENVSDIRNSKVARLINELQGYSLRVDAIDPYASSDEFFDEYKIELAKNIDKEYNAIIIAVSHDEYKEKDYSFYTGLGGANCLIADLKGLYSKVKKTGHYWTL